MKKSFPVFSANNIFSKRAVKETIGFSSNNFTGSVANDIFTFKWRTALLTIQFKKNTPEVLTLKK